MTGAERIRRVAGCDVGKASAKFVVARCTEGGDFVVESLECTPHEGRPLEVFCEWYARAGIADCDALGATGLYADDLVAPVLSGLPEDACLEAALSKRPDLVRPLCLVSVGARGYSVLGCPVDGPVQSVENDKCSSGTGETMVKLSARFGFSIDEADRIASSARSATAITARCSVFAKSELTHFANQGRPSDELLRGYFESVARHVAAMISRVQVPGPIYLIGGGSRLATIGHALRTSQEREVRVPENALVFEAIGAAAIAADQAAAERLAPLPADPERLIKSREGRIRALAPARESAHRVTRLALPPIHDDAARVPTILGMDIGSTGSKAVLVSVDTGEILHDVYDRTRGNPVDAARRLVDAIRNVQPLVRAVGVTGSGREAVMSVLRGVYPDRDEHLVVMTEIVAHATAAIRCDPDHGSSLSVVEIGGQDAKFVQIAGGQIVESDMNKACSAGTGSFLEEQATLYGVDDIEEFDRLAAEADRPPDLGQMCTVFVAEAAAQAEAAGYGVGDLFAGFQYSVIHNYKNRVMGTRSFGDRIFFQGKPASSPSLAWTLAQVTGRDVVVPPNPGAMGAWGIALLARTAIGTATLRDAAVFDLEALSRARVVARTEFQCRDPKCATLCRIEKTRVVIGDVERAVLSGGSCAKYEVAVTRESRMPMDAPSAFDERDGLIARWSDRESGVDGRVLVDVPVVGANAGVVPWLVAFLTGLGAGTRVLRSDARTLSRGEANCHAYDACAPVKVAHGILRADSRIAFMPKLLFVRDRDGPAGRVCNMEQALPVLVRRAARAQGLDVDVLAPEISLTDPSSRSLRLALDRVGEELGLDKKLVPPAIRAAFDAQREYERELAAIGRRTLEYGRTHGIPVIVVCGALHVISDSAIRASIPDILRRNAALALPMDCYPVGRQTPNMPRVPWADANRTLRVAVSARQRGNAYPLLLSSFGCGPASFVETVFSNLMEGHPHTCIETDGHGGTAGYVTRVQAFLHTVRQHDASPSPVPTGRLRLLEPIADRAIADDRTAQLVTISISDRLSPMLAAVYRSFGFDAVAAPPASSETLATGRRDCTGKECLPYQLAWGSFRTHLERSPADRRQVLLQVSGDGQCRNCMFSVKDQISIARMGRTGGVAHRHFRPEPELGTAFTSRFWSGAVAWDIIHQLAAYHRASVAPEAITVAYDSACDALEHALEEPVSRTSAALVDAARSYRAVRDVVARASETFASLGGVGLSDCGQRRVLLTGDIYLRLDDFASDGLARRLAERGLSVIVEPLNVLAEYMAHERTSDLFGLPTSWWSNASFRVAMAAARHDLYVIARRRHSWLPMPDVRAMIDAVRSVIGRDPVGEAPITIGSVLHAWRQRSCDGVVIVAPWGCGPAIVSESLLRHERDIPMLFVYGDGSPLDERRLNAFAFRMRRVPSRLSDDIHNTSSSARNAFSLFTRHA